MSDKERRRVIDRINSFARPNCKRLCYFIPLTLFIVQLLLLLLLIIVNREQRDSTTVTAFVGNKKWHPFVQRPLQHPQCSIFTIKAIISNPFSFTAAGYKVGFRCSSSSLNASDGNDNNEETEADGTDVSKSTDSNTGTPPPRPPPPPILEAIISKTTKEATKKSKKNGNNKSTKREPKSSQKKASPSRDDGDETSSEWNDSILPSGDSQEEKNFIYFTLFFGNTKKGDYRVKMKLDGTVTIIAFQEALLEQFNSALKNRDASDLQVYSGKDSTLSLGGLVLWNAEFHGGDSSNPIVVKVEPIATMAATQTNIEEASQKVKRAVALGEKFIESIMQSYEEIPESDGMYVLRNVVKLETGATRDVVLRNVTEPFWNEVIAASNKGGRVCALGTPGVGKTSTTPILIRLLFLHKQLTNITVIYNFRTVDNGDMVYIFTRSSVDGTIVTSVISQAAFPSYRSMYSKESAYYVVDPGRTKDDCNPSSLFIGKVIIVASPDERHWGGDGFMKNVDGYYGVFRIFPVWKLSELQVAKSYFLAYQGHDEFTGTFNEEFATDELDYRFIDPSNEVSANINNDKIKLRFDLVGGVPRHVFAGIEEFYRILSDQETAAEKLTESQVDYMLSDKYSPVESRSTDQPKSIIMVYGDSGSKFNKLNPQPVCSAIMYSICTKRARIFWTKIIVAGIGVGKSGWWVFECYCRHWIAKIVNADNHTFRFKQFIYEYPTSSYKNSTEIDKTEVALEGCDAVNVTGKDLFDKAKETENILFCSSNASFPFIDSLYRKGYNYYGMQMTSGKAHSFSPSKMEEYVNRAAAESGEFRLYYLVLQTKLDIFKLEVKETGKATKILRSRHNYKNWKIYILGLTEPP